MKELKLIPPTDPRVQTAIAPFTDDMLKEHDFKDRKELSESMFECMKKFHGIGLTANQVGLPFNMFVAGGHPQVNNGMLIAAFNPQIIHRSEETIMMKEGCLTYPFIFLNIKRPRKCTLKYEDENGDLKEAQLDGLMSRICQHEYDHTIGRLFVEHVSKFQFSRAKEKALKMMKQAERNGKREKKKA